MKAIKLIPIVALTAITCIMACKKNNEAAPSTGGNTGAKDSLMYDNEFSTDDGKWAVGQTTSSNATIANGFYTITNKDTVNIDYYTTGVLFYGLTDKFALESSIKVSGGNKNYAAFGGVAWNFRVGGKQLDVFGFYNDGYYEIFKYNDQGAFVELKEATLSSAVKKNDFNLLRIEQRAGVLHYLINGTEVFSRPLDTSSSSVPLQESLDLTALYADPSTTTTVDYFKTYKLH